jgi:aldehyde dehydrogenase (NAD+)
MISTTSPEIKSNTELQHIFESLRASEQELSVTTVSERQRKLRKLERALMSWRPRIKQALYADFGKTDAEVDMIDIYPTLSASRHARRNLRSWTAQKGVATPLAFAGASSSIRYEAKGVSLIISPWNYPVNLSITPLVSAIAAGCPVVLKPSELSPYASELLRDMLAEVFPSNEVYVAVGGVEVATQLLTMPFRHIYFTGSSRVGKIVMTAAAKHLTSVTLELGGKSPTIIDETASIKQAGRRITHTKWSNAGQTCIAPDYLLVHESIADELVDQIKSTVSSYFPQDKEKNDYTGIVNQDHIKRLNQYVDDAVQRGAHEWTAGVQTDSHIPPTILTNVPVDAHVMQEEIFGPILPVLEYNSIEEALRIMNALPRPLSMSVFGKDKKVRKRLISESRAGNTCINHCAIHFYNHNLPFGGINNSGIGKGHGFEGFKAFSNARSVLRQVWSYSPHEWIHAPYTKVKRIFIEFILKWL